MKKYFVAIASFIIFTNCVTQKEYDKTLNDYLNEAIKNKSLNHSLDSLKADCLTKADGLTTQLEKVRSDSTQLADLVSSLKKEIDEQTAQFSQAQKDYLQKIKDAGDKNQKTNADLLKMQLDLEKQKIALQQKEEALKKANTDLQAREARITELEKLLTDQKTKADALKEAIKKALMDFSAGELSVYTKDGKVYVSMSDKLLFKSGSTTVESKGIDALGKLSDVIKKNTDILVNIEGHTDNVPYISSNGCIKDNWDLSLMRAGSVLHILTEKYKVSPLQLIGSGRGEFLPKEPNTTAEGRAANRRTDIILAPNVDKLLELVNGKQ